MNIILNNDNGYNVDIEITEADKKKNSEENNPARVKGVLWVNEQAKKIVDKL